MYGYNQISNFHKKHTIAQGLKFFPKSLLLSPQDLILKPENQQIIISPQLSKDWELESFTCDGKVATLKAIYYQQTSFSNKKKSWVKIKLTLNQNFQLQSFEDKPAMVVDYFTKIDGGWNFPNWQEKENACQFWLDKGKLHRLNQPALIAKYRPNAENIFRNFKPINLQGFYLQGRFHTLNKNNLVLSYIEDENHVELFDLGSNKLQLVAKYGDGKSIELYQNGLLHNMNGVAKTFTNQEGSSNWFSLYGNKYIDTDRKYLLDKKTFIKQKRVIEEINKEAKGLNNKKITKIKKQFGKAFGHTSIDLELEFQIILIQNILNTFQTILTSALRIDYYKSKIDDLGEELEKEFQQQIVQGERGEDIHVTRSLLQSYGIDIIQFNTETLSEKEPQFSYAQELLQKIEKMKFGVIARLQEYSKLPLGLELDVTKNNLNKADTEYPNNVYQSVFHPVVAELQIRNYQNSVVLFENNNLATQKMRDYMVSQQLFTIENLRDILNKVEDLEKEICIYEEKIEELIDVYLSHFREEINQAISSLQILLQAERKGLTQHYQQNISEEAEELKSKLWNDL